MGLQKGIRSLSDKLKTQSSKGVRGLGVQFSRILSGLRFCCAKDGGSVRTKEFRQKSLSEVQQRKKDPGYGRPAGGEKGGSQAGG